MTEIYKIINHIAPPIMSSLFEIRVNTHNTRYFQVLSNESRRTVNYGLETMSYRAPFLLKIKITVIYLFYHPSILISFNSESY